MYEEEIYQVVGTPFAIGNKGTDRKEYIIEGKLYRVGLHLNRKNSWEML